MGEDHPRVRELLGQVHGVLPERGDAAAGVDQDRALALVRRGHEVAHRRLGERELLGARVQLDAGRAGVEAAPRLRDRAGVLRLDAAQRAQRAVRRRDPVEHHVVGLAVAVGLVHREHERARVDGREDGQQLVDRLLEAVGIVGPDVGVGIEQREARDVLGGPVEPGPQEGAGVEHAAAHYRRFASRR